MSRLKDHVVGNEFCPPRPTKTRSACGLTWYDGWHGGADAFIGKHSVAIISKWGETEYRFSLLQFRPESLVSKGDCKTLDAAKAKVEKAFIRFLSESKLQVAA